MDTTQRANVRRALLGTGFDRTAHGSDLAGVGDYTETWTHPDGTTVKIEWAPRDTTRTPGDKWRTALDQVLDRHLPTGHRPDDSSGSMTPDLLASAATQVAGLANSLTPLCPVCGHPLTAAYDDGDGFWECSKCGRDVEDRDLPAQVASAPGMADEPDTGISLPIAMSEEEDRITSGAPAATGGIDRSEHPHPSLIAAFENQRTTFTVTAEASDPEDITELTGYPVDAWRFSETALAVRVSPLRLADQQKYDPTAALNFIVLPDDREWNATSANGATALRHLPAGQDA